MFSSAFSFKFGTRFIIETMEAAGHSLSTLFLCGGLSKNPLFVQMHADITGKPQGRDIGLVENLGLSAEVKGKGRLRIGNHCGDSSYRGNGAICVFMMEKSTLRYVQLLNKTPKLARTDLNSRSIYPSFLSTKHYVGNIEDKQMNKT
jgi:hypothetical protein